MARCKEAKNRDPVLVGAWEGVRARESSQPSSDAELSLPDITHSELIN